MKQISGRQKKCAQCKKHFVPERPFQPCCSVPCAILYARDKNEKEQKAINKAQREKLKTRGDWLKEAQQWFNAWIRERDAELPCISCGRHHKGQYHAGHYRTVGACPALRFDPDNVHKQCSACNEHLSGNIVEYRKGLLEKIGAERLARIEQDHPPLKLSIEEIKELKLNYRRLVAEMKKARRT